MGLEIIGLLKKEMGLTTQMLSEMSGVPLGTLNKILNGTTQDPKLETLKAIAKVLGCTLDDFDDNQEVDEQKLLLSIFNKLNSLGRKEATKRVEELTYINMYTDVKPNYLMPIAAHNDDLTDSEKEEMNRRIIEIIEKRKMK